MISSNSPGQVARELTPILRQVELVLAPGAQREGEPVDRDAVVAVRKSNHRIGTVSSLWRLAQREELRGVRALRFGDR